MNTCTVNGVTITTDRGIASINRAFVTFADGSTYDVNTGAYHSAGPGYLMVDGKHVEPTSASDNLPPSEAPVADKAVIESATERHRFSAGRLVLRMKALDVTVQAHDEPFMEVELTGTTTMLEMVKMSVVDGALVVSEDKPRGGKVSFRSGKSEMTVISHGSFISIGGVNIGGSFVKQPTESLEVIVRVPYTTPIEAHTSSIADITIVNVDGPLDLETTGTGDITANKVSGDVKARVSSTGDIRITRGNIPYLEAITTSTGSIIVTECTAENAKVTVQSTGDIKLLNASVGYFRAATSSIGDVILRGTATNAELSVSSIGDIKVDRVVAPPIKKNNGMGSIKIGRVG